MAVNTPYGGLSGKSENAVTSLTTIVVLVVIVLVTILFFKFLKGGESILEMLGLKKSKEEKENENYIENKTNENQTYNSAWSRNLWRDTKNAKIFTAATTANLLYQLWDSVGYAWQKDKPNQFEGAIKQCKTKTQVSYLADKFYGAHQLDLLTWAKNHFDTAEQKEILAETLRYVEGLPKNL